MQEDGRGTRLRAHGGSHGCNPPPQLNTLTWPPNWTTYSELVDIAHKAQGDSVRLQEIRLRGFKSFADPADLVIGTGITGIVGPNGCGKSNIVEAILWAMGESAPSSVRTSEMDEVIFAGGSKRHARNSAEVSLLVSREGDQRVPARLLNGGSRLLNGEDLEITRRITRKSGSVYRVNGREVRARDVHTLFGDAGGGARSCAIVRQNRIGELVNAKPVARRQLIEDAAGVSGLHQRRHEVELRINATVRNIESIDEELASLDRQIGALRREAKRAQRYRKIAENLRHAEALLAFSRWRHAAEAVSRIRGDLAAATAEAARATAEATAAESARSEQSESLAPLRARQQEAAAALARTESEDAGLGERIDAADRDAKAFAARIEQLHSDLARERQLMADAEESLAELARTEAERPDDHGNTLRRELAEAELRAAAGEAPLAEAEANLDALNQAVASLEARNRQVRQSESETRSALAGVINEIEAATRDIGGAERELTDTREEVASAAEAEAQARLAAEEAGRYAERLEAARTAAEQAEQDARAAHADAAQRLAALEAERSALMGMLPNPDNGTEPVLAHIRADAGIETALGAALGEWLHLPAKESAQGPSGWVRLDRSGETMPLPDGARPLAEFVRAPSALGARLRHTGLVSSAEGEMLQRSLQPGQCLVSADGEIWRWDGLHVAADRSESDAANRVAARNRIACLDAEVETVRKATHSLEADAADRSSARAVRTGEATEARKTQRARESALAERAGSHARAQSRLELAEARLESLRLDRGKAVRIQTDLERRLDDLCEEMANSSSSEALCARAGEARSRAATLRAEALARAADCERLRNALATLEAERERRLAERTGWERRREAASSRCGDLEDRLKAAEKAMQTALEAGPALKERRHRLASLLDEARRECSMADDMLAGAEATLQEAVRRVRTAEARQAETREAAARLEERAGAAETRAAEAAQGLLDTAGCSPESAPRKLQTDAESLSEPEAYEGEILSLRQQRDRMGPVNLRAEADLAELEDARQTLASEREDLAAALARFGDAIRTINDEGRRRLQEAFSAVDRNFGDVFTSLFGEGASASLALIDSEDPFEAGLEIYAQPPGKRLLSLAQMSGGEKALTALALIFALFLTKPAPVCVLDEVDAPLDDANIQRFCDMLEDVAARTDTNFLVITHHAITISRMDRLYGVTMVERGVSQLVSVDYQETALRLSA